MPRYGELDASLSSLVKVQLYIWSQFNVHWPCLLPVLPRTFGPARGVPRTVASVKESPPFASLVRGNPSKPRENTHLVKKQQLPMTRDYKRNLKYFRVDQHFNLCLTRLERIWTPAFPLGLNWKVGCLGLWRLGKRTRKGACLTGKSTGMVLEKYVNVLSLSTTVNVHVQAALFFTKLKPKIKVWLIHGYICVWSSQKPN